MGARLSELFFLLQRGWGRGGGEGEEGWGGGSWSK